MAFDVSKIQESLNKYIVSPAAVFGLAGFVFDVEAESTTRLRAEVTDHYTEDNSYINDHMAIRPPELQLKCYVGELVFLQEGKIETFLQDSVQKLTILNAALPNLSNAAKFVKSQYESAGQFSLGEITGESLNQFRDIYALVKNLNPANGNQRQAYLYFKSLMESKTVMSYQSPFEFMTDMVITEIVAVENEDSKFISDFTITLKKVRFASITTTQYKPDSNQGRSASSKAPVIKKGNVSGKKVPDLLTMDMIREFGLQGIEPLTEEDLFP